jgi:hypothetical protein
MFLWQTSNPQIPWAQAANPYGSALVAKTNANSTFGVAGNITGSGYIIGYAAGANAGNIVATSFVPDATQTPTNQINFVPSLSLYQPPESGAVSFLYSLPPGSTPLKNNHWVGIYTGQFADITTFPDAASGAIPTNNANTSITLFPNLTANAYYTAAYFAGGYNSTTPSQSKLNGMCALITFMTGST